MRGWEMQEEKTMIAEKLKYSLTKPTIMASS